jgi:hypothetical protein
MAAINRGVSIKEAPTGPAVPPLIPLDAQARAGVAACNGAGQAAFRALLQQLVMELVDAAAAAAAGASPAQARLEALFAAQGEGALGAARALAGSALHAALRSGRAAADLLPAAAALGLQEALAGDLVGVATGAQAGALLLPALARGAPRHPGLARLRWRLDVALSTSALAKVMRTVVLVEATLDSGRVVAFEVPPERFAELRYGAAKTLQEMGAIESHPVLRI